MFERILVPLDGSSFAEMALHPALRLAQWSDACVYLLRIPTYRQTIMPDATGEVLVWEEEIETTVRIESEEYLQQLQGRYPQHRICTRVLEGDEAGTIIDVAREEGIDLIVMSTHGYSGLTRWVLGSVTERVLRNGPCPVMVIRNEEPIRNVLVTLDGSELSHLAIGPGLEVAQRLGAEVCLLRVYTGGHLSEEESVQLDWQEDQGQRNLHDSARESVLSYLNNTAQGLELPGQHIRVAAMEGAPAPTILDYANAQGFELIIMATHGRTGFRRWVYGSVAEKIMRSAQCNVLITRPADEDLS